jgi:hypothetical protein
VKGCRLEILKIGTRPYTTGAALEEFFRAISAVGSSPAPAQRTLRDQEAGMRKAKTVLTKGGV